LRTLTSPGTLCHLISFLLITFPGSVALVPPPTTGVLPPHVTLAWPALAVLSAQGADNPIELWQQPTQAQDLQADSRAITADGLMLLLCEGDLLSPSPPVHAGWKGRRMDKPDAGDPLARQTIVRALSSALGDSHAPQAPVHRTGNEKGIDWQFFRAAS
jgi:hypothetical protein